MGSSYERVQSHTEDIPGRVNVSIEDIPAVADYLSYSQATDTFRPLVGQDAATRRDLGCVRLIGLQHAPAIPNGLVREHLLEARPPGSRGRSALQRSLQPVDRGQAKPREVLIGIVVDRIGNADLRANIVGQVGSRNVGAQ
jgi:hypothetical protein